MGSIERTVSVDYLSEYYSIIVIAIAIQRRISAEQVSLTLEEG